MSACTNCVFFPIPSHPHPSPLLTFPPLSSEETEGRPPITIQFEIPYFTMSGVQVRYLKIIEKSGYQALPWVRYITQNGGKGRGREEGS